MKEKKLQGLSEEKAQALAKAVMGVVGADVQVVVLIGEPAKVTETGVFLALSCVMNCPPEVSIAMMEARIQVLKENGTEGMNETDVFVVDPNEVKH